MNLSSIPVLLDTNHPNGYCKGMPSHPKDSMNHYHLIEINFIFQPFFSSHDDYKPRNPFRSQKPTFPPPLGMDRCIDHERQGQNSQAHHPSTGGAPAKKPLGGPLKVISNFHPKKERYFFCKSGFFSCILT